MRLQRRRRALLGYLNMMGAMIFMLGIVSGFAYLAARLPDLRSGMPFIDNTSEVLRRYLNANAVGLLDMLALIGVAIGLWDVAAGWADRVPAKNQRSSRPKRAASRSHRRKRKRRR